MFPHFLTLSRRVRLDMLYRLGIFLKGIYLKRSRGIISNG